MACTVAVMLPSFEMRQALMDDQDNNITNSINVPRCGCRANAIVAVTVLTASRWRMQLAVELEMQDAGRVLQVRTIAQWRSQRQVDHGCLNVACLRVFDANLNRGDSESAWWITSCPIRAPRRHILHEFRNGSISGKQRNDSLALRVGHINTDSCPSFDID